MLRQLAKLAVVVASLVSACIFAQPAYAVDYRWYYEFGTGGISEAGIKSKDGSTFVISCAVGGNGLISIELTNPKLREGETDLQVVVDDSVSHFVLVKGRKEISARLDKESVQRMVDSLRKTKARYFKAELPAVDHEVQFSTLGAATTLKGALDGCVDAPKVTPQVSTRSDRLYVGRWYTGPASLCKGEQGETEGLLVYTPQEFFGLENTCQIQQVVPKGPGFELAMQCNGEGMTSTDREYVEVRNGKLRRTLVVARKSQTFTYNRCPD